jgi:hypothetical protein
VKNMTKPGKRIIDYLPMLLLFDKVGRSGCP